MASLQLGPASVRWWNVDLGLTKSVVVRLSKPSVDLKTDQTGIEDSVEVGFDVSVEVGLAEENFKTLSAAYKGLIKQQSVSEYAVYGTNKVGKKLKNSAKELLLIKYSEGAESTDYTDRYYFFKAYPLANVECVFDSENQVVIKVVFKCLLVHMFEGWVSFGAGNVYALFDTDYKWIWYLQNEIGFMHPMFKRYDDTRSHIFAFKQP